MPLKTGNDILIEVRNLTKTYHVGEQVIRAVDGVGLTIQRGGLVSVVGHSGSGKTTLLSLIGGLTRPDSGSIIIDGIDIWSMDDDGLSEFRNKKISFVYQFSSLIPTLTALENVLLPTAFGGLDEGAGKRARELLDLVGMGDFAALYPSQLSGGQQRRVAIARAFINNPEIILADEPTGDLDEKTEAEVIELFKRINEEKGITFIIVTHSSELSKDAKMRFRMSGGRLNEI